MKLYFIFHSRNIFLLLCFYLVSCDKSVDVEDFEGKQCGTRFFVHTVRLKERPTEQEVGVLPSVSTATSGAPKRRNSAGLSSNKKSKCLCCLFVYIKTIIC